jgi:hypothetical protein
MTRPTYRPARQQQSIGGQLDYAQLSRLCPKPAQDRRSLAATGDEAAAMHANAWQSPCTEASSDGALKGS